MTKTQKRNARKRRASVRASLQLKMAVTMEIQVYDGCDGCWYCDSCRTMRRPNPLLPFSDKVQRIWAMESLRLCSTDPADPRQISYFWKRGQPTKAKAIILWEGFTSGHEQFLAKLAELKEVFAYASTKINSAGSSPWFEIHFNHEETPYGGHGWLGRDLETVAADVIAALQR